MNEDYVRKMQMLKTEYRVKYKDMASRLGVDRSFVSKMVNGVKLIPVKYYGVIDEMVRQMKGGE